MSTRFHPAKAMACAMAGAFALSAGAAQAQPYGYNSVGSGSYSYDPCKREQTQRGTLGAVLGGGAGAVIGSNAAARNARTEGALLGGLLGAVLGGVVGNKSAACTAGAPLPASNTPPAEAPPPRETLRGPPPAYYGRDEYARREASEDAYAYGRRGERYRMADERGPGADGCTLAESPIYMPDGRVQTRFVRVCRDSTGRYAVVE